MPANDHSPDQGIRNAAAVPRPSRPAWLVFAGLLLLLATAGTLEALYRAFQEHRCACPRGGAGGYFSLYIVGESIAAGEPYDPGITPGGLVAGILGGRIGGLPVKEFNLARRGDTIYPQSVALERALRCRGNDGPGAVLIYSGNSDAGGRRGMPAPEWIKENILSRSLLLGDAAYYAEKRFPFLRVRTLDTYQHYLRRVVELSLKSGLTPILTTVPSNLAGMDPGLFSGPDAERGETAAILSAGLELETTARPRQAIHYYSVQARAHPGMRAYLAYRAGKCCQALGLYRTAGNYYREAADLSFSDNFNRASPAQNGLIRELAKDRAVPLADALDIFERSSPHGLVGSGLFADGHHPNMKGYLLLASAWAEQIARVFHEPVKRSFRDPEDAYKFFSYGRDKQAAALVTTGRWLFNAAARHLWPYERLKMARGCFERAIALDPDNFSAWLALGLTEAAVRGGLLSDEKKINWLAGEGLGFYHEADYALESGRLDGILNKLASYGVPAGLLKTISQKAAKAEARARLKKTAGIGNSPASTTRAGPGSRKTFLEQCRRLAGENQKEEALHACQSAVFPADSGKAGQPDDRLLASDASFESYKLLKALGREEEAGETLLWTIKNAPASWPGLAEAEKAGKDQR